MPAAISFVMVENGRGGEHALEISGGLSAGMPHITFRGAQFELILKGFNADQLDELQRVARQLAERLRNGAPAAEGMVWGQNNN